MLQRHQWEGNRKRVYELEKADNETGFAGVRAYTATDSKGYTNKKRFYSDEATGAFFTPEEAALERAKFIAKKSGRLEPAFTCDMCSP